VVMYGRIEGQLVDNSDFGPFALSELESRSRVLIIDEDHFSFKAIWRTDFPCQL
jgi:hypothetical protein